jgi:hypothetical protein
MEAIPNASGVVSLLTVDGGPGQKKWWNLRLSTSRVGSADAVAIIKINGKDVKSAGGAMLTHVTEDEPLQTVSDHVRLMTGDVVTAQVFGTVCLQFSASVDTEEV